MNSVMEIPPSISSVVAALRDLGLRKAGTPLLIASTPVSAAHPEEKARATRNTSAKPDQLPVLGVQVEVGRLGAQRVAEDEIRNNPQPSITRTPTMNA